MIYLASRSPRRQQLFEQLGLSFTVRPSRFNEASVSERDPRSLVTRLAQAKARAVAAEVKEGIVIAADTVIEFQGQIIGKPKDKPDALRILKAFQGKNHRVLTAIIVVDAASGRLKLAVEEAMVMMKNVPEARLMRYVETVEPLDLAGAYNILEEQAKEFFSLVTGDIETVAGLPTKTLRRLLNMLESS